MHTCVGQKCRKGMMRDKEEFNVRKGTRQDNKEEEREKEKKLTLIQVFYNIYMYQKITGFTSTGAEFLIFNTHKINNFTLKN